MKTISKIGILLLATTIIFGVPACKKEKKPETQTPTSGGSGNGGSGGQPGTSMAFTDLDSYYDKIIYLDFVDDNNGWVIGYNQTDLSKRILMNTSDAGSTWNVIDNNFDLDYDNGYISGEALQFINATDGFRLSDNGNTNNDALLKLQHSEDKGATWTSFSNPFFTTSGGNTTYEYVDWWGRSFASNDVETLFFGSNPNNIYLFKINNNTKAISYSQKYSKSTYTTNIVDHAGNGLYLAQNGTITAVNDGSNGIEIIQSTDNGATWTVAHATGKSYFSSANWINDNVGFVVAGDNAGFENKFLYKTTDGGATWTETEMNQKFLMIRFADANHGMGVRGLAFSYTNDGGSTWTEKMEYTTGGQYAVGFDEVISYPSLNNGWVPGSKYYDAQGNYNSKDGLFKFTGN